MTPHLHTWTATSPMRCADCGRHFMPWRLRARQAVKWKLFAMRYFVRFGRTP